MSTPVRPERIENIERFAEQWPQSDEGRLCVWIVHLERQLQECRELLRASEHDNSSDIANIEWHRRRDKQIDIQQSEVGRV